MPLVLLGLMLGFLILLAMPFDIGYYLKKDDHFCLRLSIAWAYGLLSKQRDKPPEKPKDQTTVKKKTPRKQRRTGKGNLTATMALMRSPGMSASLLRLARNM